MKRIFKDTYTKYFIRIFLWGNQTKLSTWWLQLPYKSFQSKERTMERKTVAVEVFLWKILNFVCFLSFSIRKRCTYLKGCNNYDMLVLCGWNFSFFSSCTFPYLKRLKMRACLLYFLFALGKLAEFVKWHVEKFHSLPNQTKPLN